MELIGPGDVEFFHENGFLPARPCLSPSEASRLRSAFQRIREGKSKRAPEIMRNLTGDEENVVIQVVNAWEFEPAFRKHLFHPAITTAVAQLMRTDVVRVWHDQIQFKPPFKGGPTVWHQDYPYWPVLEPSDLVSAWVALEDADEENGCMSMVSRSHRWGIYRDGTVGIRPDNFGPDFDPAFIPSGEKVEIVACPAPAGHVMFHHCLTWHGAPPNRSERGRPAIAVHYMPGHTRFVPKSEHAISHHIAVGPGEILHGKHFPTVFEGAPKRPLNLNSDEKVPI